MSEIAIRVENLGKAYKIVHNADRGHYKTLQEDLIALVKRPFNRSANGGRETFWALKDVSFEVKQGEVLGIIGRNGAGKSTLLKILSRITRPTTGYAEMHGRVGSLLEVGTGFHPELTGRENIFLNGAVLGMSRNDIQRKFDEIVQFADVEQFLDTPVKRYSSGMYMRLAFAVAAHLEPEILVVDEVLSVGDAEFQKKSLGKMSEVAKGGRTVLFVSYNMVAVQSLCQRVLWLSSGVIRDDGLADKVILNYLDKGSQVVLGQKWDKPQTAPGNSEVRLNRISVHATEGDPYQISTVTSFILEFVYWNLVPDSLLSLSLHVYNDHEIMAFNTAPVHEIQWMGKPFPIGLFRSQCFVPGYLLNSGTYRVDLLVVKDQNRVIYRHENALVFEVVDSMETRGVANWFGKWPGVVHPKLEWSTEKLNEEPSADRMT